MRNALAILIAVLFCQTGWTAEVSPLKGLEGAGFSFSINTMAGINVSKDRIARTAENALKKAGILQKGAAKTDYPQLSLVVHGGIKQGTIFFVWELQMKEKVAIAANGTYRKTAYQGMAATWQSSGMMTTSPAAAELDLMKQIETAINGFVKQWQGANTVAGSRKESR